MAKKLSDIQKLIESEAIPFHNYIEKKLDKDVVSFLNKLSGKSDVYIFSGIIRNYFLKIEDYRDIDVYLDGKFDIERMINNFTFQKNSYGGYKISINNTIVDLWFLENTWALTNHQTILDLDLAKYIPNTSFFNFSSIIFSLNENKFYYTKPFLRFLRDKKIDIVYVQNPNNALCVVNSIYYVDKLKLKLGKKLINHIKKIYKSNIDKYQEAQLKHFGKILYTNDVIKERIENL